MSYCIRQSI